MKLLKGRKLVLAIISILILVSVVSLGVIFFKPSVRWMHTSLVNGKYPNYYSLPPGRSENVMLTGKNFEFEAIDALFSGEDVWKKFHFLDVELILPVDHPSFLLSPLLKYNGKDSRPTLGLSIYGPTQKPRNYFIIGEDFVFNPDYYSQKFFEVPYNFRYLTSIPLDKVWQDLFSKDLVMIGDHDYDDYLYQLFLLHTRYQVFPKNARKISYFKEQRTGIVEVPYLEAEYRKEIIYQADRGVVRTYYLVTRRDDVYAEEVRRKVLTELRFKLADRGGIKEIYEEYKKLSYNERITDKGMIFLFSAFSQDLDNRDILKQMIQFLERGRNNFVQLQPLYEYAYIKFGTNMSRRDEVLLEREKERRAREARERLADRLKKIEALKIRDEGKRKFATPEEEVLFKLQDAKNNPENIDKSKTKFYIP